MLQSKPISLFLFSKYYFILFIISSRDTIKIGLIYVAYGQDTQKQLFHNDSGSEIYNEFVNSLAWPVSIKTPKFPIRYSFPRT